MNPYQTKRVGTAYHTCEDRAVNQYEPPRLVSVARFESREAAERYTDLLNTATDMFVCELGY